MCANIREALHLAVLLCMTEHFPGTRAYLTPASNVVQLLQGQAIISTRFAAEFALDPPTLVAYCLLLCKVKHGCARKHLSRLGRVLLSSIAVQYKWSCVTVLPPGCFVAALRGRFDPAKFAIVPGLRGKPRRRALKVSA